MDETVWSAYLQRIAVPRPLAADTVTLRVLHRAHQLMVPFENLSMHLSEPISLADADLIDKIVHRGRGGICYEPQYRIETRERALSDFAPAC